MVQLVSNDLLIGPFIVITLSFIVNVITEYYSVESVCACSQCIYIYDGGKSFDMLTDIIPGHSRRVENFKGVQCDENIKNGKKYSGRLDSR